MALSFGPKLGLLINGLLGESHYAELMKQWRGLDALIQASVKDKDLTAPPGSPADGDCYIVGAAATGAWATHSGKIARYSSAAAGWEFYTPKEGWRVAVDDEDTDYRYSGSAWVHMGDVNAVPSYADGSLPAASSMSGRKVFNITYNVEMRSNGTRWIPLGPFTVEAGAPDDTVTGVTNVETLMRTVKIPGGYVGPEGSVQLYCRWNMTNNTNAKNPLVRLHSSAAIGGSSYLAPAGTSIANQFAFQVIHAAGSEASQMSANAASTTSTGTAVPRDSTVNMAADSYLVFTCQPVDPADTVILKYYSVRVFPGGH